MSHLPVLVMDEAHNASVMKAVREFAFEWKFAPPLALGESKCSLKKRGSYLQVQMQLQLRHDCGKLENHSACAPWAVARQLLSGHMKRK